MQWQPNKWTVVRGDDAQVLLHLLDTDGTPLNISGATTLNLILKNSDNSKLTLPASQGLSVGLGRPMWVYSFTLTAEQTALLALAPSQVVEIEVHWNGLMQKFFFTGVLTTIEAVIL